MAKKTTAILMSIINELAKERKGGLFIITKEDMKKEYEQLYPSLFDGKNIRINANGIRPLLLKLAELDGAIIIDSKGYIRAYGAKIKKTKVVFGHGTRHSAARGISEINNTLSILASEEDGMIRIFRQGNLIAEMNPITGKDKTFFEKFAEVFTKPDIQVATSGGVASLLLGLNPLMAGAVFTGSWIITKYGLASIKDFMRTGKIVVKEEPKNVLKVKQKKETTQATKKTEQQIQKKKKR